MFINLSEVISEPHIAVRETVIPESEQIRIGGSTYKIVHKEPFSLTVSYEDGERLHVIFNGSLKAEAPCDRCLETVVVDLEIEADRVIPAKTEPREDEDDFDEANYIDGYLLDVEQLLCNEILVGWPTKILCKDDCKGICSVCGQNLNKGTCSCEDTSLDPRMSVIRDLYKNFKEV